MDDPGTPGRVPFERYADDIVCIATPRCKLDSLWVEIARRLKTLGLELRSEKTKVVYCKDANRPGEAEHTSFDFLGFTFRARLARGPRGYFMSFAPALSPAARKAISQTIRAWHLRRRSSEDLSSLAREINPQVSGWIGYYGAFYRSELHFLAFRIDQHLVRWARHKFKRLRYSPAGHGRCSPLSNSASLDYSRTGRPTAAEGSACKSRMTGDCHVRFCERRGVRFPPATRLRVR